MFPRVARNGPNTSIAQKFQQIRVQRNYFVKDKTALLKNENRKNPIILLNLFQKTNLCWFVGTSWRICEQSLRNIGDKKLLVDNG